MDVNFFIELIMAITTFYIPLLSTVYIFWAPLRDINKRPRKESYTSEPGERFIGIELIAVRGNSARVRDDSL